METLNGAELDMDNNTSEKITSKRGRLLECTTRSRERGCEKSIATNLHCEDGI